MAVSLPPIPPDPIGENFKWRDWFRNLGNYIQKVQFEGLTWQDVGGLATVAHTADYYDLINLPTIPSGDYIECVDTSTSIALTSTPILLQPSTVVANKGTTYDSSTGVFTWPTGGTYNQVITVNAEASAANQYVYIWAENWNGTSWVVNTYSGKQQVLVNNYITQVILPNAIRRNNNQQVRYWIASNGNNVSLKTTTLPSGAIIPAIRIQYS